MELDTTDSATRAGPMGCGFVRGRSRAIWAGMRGVGNIQHYRILLNHEWRF